jgi:hypothetical protein
MLALMLVSLPACQNAKPTPIKTQVVEVPVEVRVPVDKHLTDHGPKPARPANRCKDARGRATICNRDLASWLNAYDALVDTLFGKLDAIAEQQAPPLP